METKHKLYFILFVYLFSLFVLTDNGKDLGLYVYSKDATDRIGTFVHILLYALLALGVYEFDKRGYTKSSTGVMVLTGALLAYCVAIEFQQLRS
jgi:hypothetical protein